MNTNTKKLIRDKNAPIAVPPVDKLAVAVAEEDIADATFLPGLCSCFLDDDE